MVLATLATVLAAPPAAAQGAATSGDPSGGSLGVALVVSLLALLPFAFLTLTAFVKISTVLQIARGAIGAQNIPSNSVIMALSIALTLVAMAPVGSRMADRARPLLTADTVRSNTELVTGVLAAVDTPLRGFLSANAHERERERFYELSRNTRPEGERDEVGRTDLVVVIPAFVVSELMEAFALGFAIFLPFLVIDLVVANVLLALGMQMMNPNQVSLPFKLLLFVAVDGWGLLAQALVTGYAPG